MPRWSLWALAIVAAFIIGAAALLYSLDNGVPFIEGDWVTRSGTVYGFAVGGSRADTLRVIRKRYAKPGNELRVVWERASPMHAQLASYENPESKRWTQDEHSHWRKSISAVSDLLPPLQLVDRWDIELPGGWVNTIHVTFSNDKVVEVQRSRWLFERP